MISFPVLDKGYVEYIAHLGSDTYIAEGARVSTGSISKGEEQDAKLIEYLYKNAHSSPLEFGNITMQFKMPIFVAREFFRHRTFRFSEKSARFGELTNDFYIPTRWRKQAEKNLQCSVETDELNDKTLTIQTENHCKKSFALYKKFLDEGVAREMARMVLPVNIYTEFRCNMDMSNLCKFLTLRTAEGAQKEIREYAFVMKKIAQVHFPAVINAWEKYKFKYVEENI